MCVHVCSVFDCVLIGGCVIAVLVGLFDIVVICVWLSDVVCWLLYVYVIAWCLIVCVVGVCDACVLCVGWLLLRWCVVVCVLFVWSVFV